MAKFKITHRIDWRITHEIDAPTAALAESLAVGKTFELIDELNKQYPHLVLDRVGTTQLPERLIDDGTG